MGCRDRESCRQRHENWLKLQEKYTPIGAEELEVFLEKMQKKQAFLHLDEDHFGKRSLERAVSVKDVLTVVENGWVIERRKRRGYTSLLIMGYLKHSSSYRPLHVVCDIVTDTQWWVITVYDPRSKPWKWDENYEQRVCFCS
ncbi:hypothetical protein GCM10007416_31600 [Kroppenstedtia guangzhouensis]|uniref:DUF4258 domain-containing protein n=1 Tax=Kroppenstedtia guangzhouensis TaxID=1274356 RepID=A0ABQ1H2Z9_9BACL|nr:DUF4258 domain-containing protein [Kroppenstedtia guangzhouensis]GGA56104.1 hypothetical protein GCM10007416_31600 [Kroppenstedtia guangzhouensis]